MKNALHMAARMEAGNPTVHDIYIYDDIEKYGDLDWMTFEYTESETSAEHIRKMMEDIPKDDTINIFINSDGGDVEQALAIASMIRRHPGQTVAIVDGAAHSAAFLIVQAAKKRVMYSGTSAIIHNMWTVVQGNAKELREAADQLDKMMDSVVAMFMERAKIPEKELRDMMDETTVLTPEKALEFGLIDEIATGETKIPTADKPADDTDTSIDETDADELHGFDAYFNE